MDALLKKADEIIEKSKAKTPARFRNIFQIDNRGVMDGNYFFSDKIKGILINNIHNTRDKKNLCFKGELNRDYFEKKEINSKNLRVDYENISNTASAGYDLNEECMDINLDDEDQKVDLYRNEELKKIRDAVNLPVNSLGLTGRMWMVSLMGFQRKNLHLNLDQNSKRDYLITLTNFTRRKTNFGIPNILFENEAKTNNSLEDLKLTMDNIKSGHHHEEILSMSNSDFLVYGELILSLSLELSDSEKVESLNCLDFQLKERRKSTMTKSKTRNLIK